MHATYLWKLWGGILISYSDPEDVKLRQGRAGYTLLGKIRPETSPEISRLPERVVLDPLVYSRYLI